MAKKRDTNVYTLKDGNKIVYIGETNNPDRREQQHRKEKKNFGRMEIISPALTPEGARKKEKERLATYRQNHGGKNPKYNKDSDG